MVGGGDWGVGDREDGLWGDVEELGRGEGGEGKRVLGEGGGGGRGGEGGEGWECVGEGGGCKGR